MKKRTKKKEKISTDPEHLEIIHSGEWNKKGIDKIMRDYRDCLGNGNVLSIDTPHPRLCIATIEKEIDKIMRDYTVKGNVLLMETPYPRLYVVLNEDAYEQFLDSCPDETVSLNVGSNKKKEEPSFGYMPNTGGFVSYNGLYHWFIDLAEAISPEAAEYLTVENKRILLKINPKHKDVLSKYAWQVKWELPDIIIYAEGDENIQITDVINSIKAEECNPMNAAELDEKKIDKWAKDLNFVEWAWDDTWPWLKITLSKIDYYQFISGLRLMFGPDSIIEDNVTIWTEQTKKPRIGCIVKGFGHVPYIGFHIWIIDLSEKTESRDDCKHFLVENDGEVIVIRVDPEYGDVLDKFDWQVDWTNPPNIIIHANSNGEVVHMQDVIDNLKRSGKPAL